ncbi:MAG: ammonium transporter [Bacteroidales bacterium]|jgi:Amt family ammonium transporter|nr:ammonium transporter [Bacteroidales bacterium]
MFNTGTTTFMLISTSLVMLMTPGLAFFYGGLAGRKNILGIMMQTFVSLGITTVMWIGVGYSLSFSGGEGGIIGNLDHVFLRGIAIDAAFGQEGQQFPEYIFIAYQMMFAIITPALITGAFVNRVSFKGYLIFLVLWQLFVYYPFVHMIWGGGIMAEWGILDFAGGIVVHATAGFAALASVIYVGKRQDRQSPPNSIPLVAIGTGLLWFGWYGFNAGSELAVDKITTLAFLNTDIAASFAAVTWLIVEWVKTGKPKFIGLLTGAVAGLATVTPAAGFIPVWAAIIIGIASGIVCYIAVHYKNKFGWDDALDVWGVHGMGGVTGTILLGVFASEAVNGQSGLLEGNSAFFFKEVIAVVIGSAYAFLFTYLMLVVINKITKVKVSEEEEAMGLDYSLHGENAYDSGAL